MPKSLVSSSAPLCNGAENIQFIKLFTFQSENILSIQKYRIENHEIQDTPRRRRHPAAEKTPRGGEQFSFYCLVNFFSSQGLVNLKLALNSKSRPYEENFILN